MNYLFIAAYAAPYPGNFIKSLEKLEETLINSGNKIIYAFNEEAKECDWCKQIKNRTNVYFLPTEKARIKPTTYITIRKILKKEKIDVVHSHFELYDLPVAVVAPKNVKIFWHLHDAIDYEKEGTLHKILNKIQYSWFGNKAKLISVNDFYREKVIELGMKKENTYTVSNGIDLSRIRKINSTSKQKYLCNFFTLGWSYEIKGVDIILDACEKLEREGINFKLLLNGNNYTWKKLEKRYTKDPKWLIRQDFIDDINIVFNKANHFIQASRRETFSYAIAEAVYANKDVIASDIEGIKWAKNIPTVHFFESESSKQLYSIMKEYLNKDREGQEIYTKEDYENASNIIKSNYSVEKWAEKIINIYNENNN